jgi:Ribbon-helix-helix domain
VGKYPNPRFPPPSFSEFPYFRPIATYMPVWYRVVVKRTALFLKEEQVKKLQVLSDKTGAPVSELIRRAVDEYLLERGKELK